MTEAIATPRKPGRKPLDEPRVTRSYTLPPDIADAIDASSELRGCTKSRVVEDALVLYFSPLRGGDSIRK